MVIFFNLLRKPPSAAPDPDMKNVTRLKAFTHMATALSEKHELSAEKALLEDVFEQESRPDGDYYIYNYDQRYYKVLSACAKLKLKVRNLPEGNPSYVEIKAEDWDRVIVGTSAPAAAPAETTRPAFASGALRMMDITTPVNEDEPDIERAVERLAARSAPAIRISDKEIPMEDTRPVRPEETLSASYHAKLQALKSREQALSTREEAVHIREEAVQQREAAITGAEEDLYATEQRLAAKEKDLEAFSDDLEALRRDLDEETAYLKDQRKQMLDLAEHLRKSAESLLSEDV